MATSVSTQAKVNPTNISRVIGKNASPKAPTQVTKTAPAGRKVYSTSFASSAPKSPVSKTATRIGTVVRNAKTAFKK